MKNNFSKTCLYLAFAFIFIHLIIYRLIQNSLQSLWLDESIMVFIANHPLFSKSFFMALTENIAGMPWPFIEYRVYLHILKLLPFNYVFDHLEFFLRLPLTFYSTITAVCAFLMVRRLSTSTVFASIVTFFLFGVNYLSAHLGSELRFHSSAFMHITISWMLLSYILTMENNKHAKLLWILWLISAMLTGFSHLYGIYSLGIEAIVLLLNINGNLSKKSRILSLIYLGFAIAAQILFYKFCTIHPYHRDLYTGDVSVLIKTTFTILNHYIFIPNLWLWLIFFSVAWILALLKQKTLKEKIHYGLLGILALLQLTVMAVLCFIYLYWQWGPENWAPRYIIAGVVPFVFFLSLLSKNLFQSGWDNKLSIVIGICILWFYIFSGHACRTYWPEKKDFDPSDRWLQIKTLIQKNNAYGKVNAALGVAPNRRAIDQRDIYGNSLDVTWQIYTGGPFSTSSFLQYDKDFLAGRKGFPCAVRDLYPIAQGIGKSFVIDFCEKDAVSLRILEN